MADPISQLKIAQFAVCKAPFGKTIATNKLKSYLNKIPSKDLINILCKEDKQEIETSITNIIKELQIKYPLDPTVKLVIGIFNSKKNFIINTLIQVRNNPKIQPFLTNKCPTLLRSTSIKNEELINALIEIFCTLPLGIDAIKSLSQNTAKNKAKIISQSGLRFYNEMGKLKNIPKNKNKIIIENINKKQQLITPIQTAPAAGGKRRRTNRKYKKARKTRRNRRV
jgi:hypothetical protein